MVAALAACRSEEVEPAAPGRLGVRVPLPAGWTAHGGPDQSLVAGPAGRPALRIERWASRGGELPASHALERAARAVAGEGLVVRERIEEDDAALVRYGLAGPDGGRGAEGFLGALRVGGDLFLCASLPGAAAEEVEHAARACLGLSVPGG